jgi:hypothetical protein
VSIRRAPSPTPNVALATSILPVSPLTLLQARCFLFPNSKECKKKIRGYRNTTYIPFLIFPTLDSHMHAQASRTKNMQVQNSTDSLLHRATGTPADRATPLSNFAPASRLGPRTAWLPFRVPWYCELELVMQVGARGGC